MLIRQSREVGSRIDVGLVQGAVIGQAAPKLTSRSSAIGVPLLITAGLAVGRQWFQRSNVGLVTVEAGVALGDETMLLAGTAVDVVTAQAGHGFLAESGSVSDVLQDMPIRSAQGPKLSIGGADFEVAEEIVSRNEVVGVWASRTLRLAGPNMTLSTDQVTTRADSLTSARIGEPAPGPSRAPARRCRGRRSSPATRSKTLAPSSPPPSSGNPRTNSRRRFRPSAGDSRN